MCQWRCDDLRVKTDRSGGSQIPKHNTLNSPDVCLAIQETRRYPNRHRRDIRES